MHSMNEQLPEDQADVPWWRPTSWAENRLDFPDGALRSVEPVVPVLFDVIRQLGPYEGLEDESACMGLPPFDGLDAARARARADASSSSRG